MFPFSLAIKKHIPESTRKAGQSISSKLYRDFIQSGGTNTNSCFLVVEVQKLCSSAMQKIYTKDTKKNEGEKGIIDKYVMYIKHVEYIMELVCMPS